MRAQIRKHKASQLFRLLRHSCFFVIRIWTSSSHHTLAGTARAFHGFSDSVDVARSRSLLNRRPNMERQAAHCADGTNAKKIPKTICTPEEFHRPRDGKPNMSLPHWMIRRRAGSGSMERIKQDERRRLVMGVRELASAHQNERVGRVLQHDPRTHAPTRKRRP